jgi:hypothetical protein
VTLTEDLTVKAIFGCILGMPVEPEVAIYEAVVTAVVGKCDTAGYKPIGVGLAAAGLPLLNLNVVIPQFGGAIDAYLVVYAPDLDRENLYVMGPDNALRPFSDGLVAWRAGVTTEEEEWPWAGYGQLGMPIPAGSYYFGLIVSPAGSDLTEPYSFWVTGFTAQ